MHIKNSGCASRTERKTRSRETLEKLILSEVEQIIPLTQSFYCAKRQDAEPTTVYSLGKYGPTIPIYELIKYNSSCFYPALTKILQFRLRRAINHQM